MQGLTIHMTRKISATMILIMVASCSDTNLSGKSATRDPPKNDAEARPTLPPPATDAPITTNSVTVRDGIGRIVCTKRDLLSSVVPGSTSEVYTRDFRADECDGKLPNSEFFGFSASEEICGADREWRILEPRNGENPGISVRYLGACPGPVNPSLISVVWVHRDSALVQGETSAASADQLRERIKSRTATITCRKINFNPGTEAASAGKNIKFVSSECTGGRLPDTSYVGLLGKRQVCGLNESWTQPGPGEVSFVYLGGIQACLNALEPSDIEVLYILK